MARTNMEAGEALREALEEGPLILYGWTADALLATIIALAHSESSEIGLEPTTTWRPSRQYLESIAVRSRDYKSVVLLGVNWTGVDIDLLAPMVLAPIIVVDNNYMHILPHRSNVIVLNPSPKGDPRGVWPSVAAIVSSLLGGQHPLLAAAGIVSRMWSVAPSNRMYQNLASMAGLNHKEDYDLVAECAWQAYGITAAGDPRVYGRVPQSVVEASGWDPCKGLLSDTLITTLRADAEESYKAAVENASIEVHEAKVRVLLEGEGRHYYLASYMAALEHPDKLAVTGYQDTRERVNYACAWHIKGKRPLARKLGEARGDGFEASGGYQGPLNYLCVKPGKNEAGVKSLVDYLTRLLSG